MALFRRTKKEEKKKEEKPEKTESSASPRDTSPAGDLSDVLRTPRITEKATSHSELGVYTFDIAANATKRSVSQAVAALYKVTPRKIRIVPVPSKVKRSVRTGARGISRGGKKAYIYLKKGDTITLT